MGTFRKGSDKIAVTVTALVAVALLVALSVSPALGGVRGGKDRLAWRAMMPAIEVFWKEYQTSPEKLKEDVWPLISMLKNFIKAFPDSEMLPEAYYILGEAYASVSYWPEAEAHWKIVTRYFPNSRWTNQALNSLVMFYERSNNREKLRSFYREIMRRFPDSIAAKTAQVLIAREALLRGDVKLARRVAKAVSRSSPMAEVEVPELLDLKARLALHDNKPKEAIKLWVRYLNLIRNPSVRASTLFQIAETYRRLGDFLKARKYYALIRRDFKGQPEYLFAKFRILQIKEETRKRLSRYTKGQISNPDYFESEQVFNEILKRFPKHPLTLEVKKEFVATELRKKDYVKALELAEKYLREDPDSPYARDILLMADQARQGLLTTEYDIPELQRIVAFARPFLQTEKKSQIYDYIRSVAEAKWVELEKRLIDASRPLEALKEYWDFKRFFKEETVQTVTAFRLAKKALIMADKTFLKKGQQVQLVNFHLKNQGNIEKLSEPYHYYYLAQAYGGLDLAEASLRAYQAAWNLEPAIPLRCRLLMDWIDEMIEANKQIATQDAITLLNLNCPEQSISAKALLYKSILATWQRDYRAALSMALDSIGIKPSPLGVRQAINGAIYLGEWDVAWKVYQKSGRLLSKDERARLLRKWGDEAMNLGMASQAKRAYLALKEMDTNEPADGFRLNLALSALKGPAQAAEIWAKAAKEGEGVWGKASKAEASFYKFMKKAGSSL
ncbi:MAG: tetratricopeptide repeat protein [Thermodesulfobacteria bacterium]|nr:tetratricopeptide repeat protein [Thermodesulfobacteriota bacterium]